MVISGNKEPVPRKLLRILWEYAGFGEKYAVAKPVFLRYIRDFDQAKSVRRAKGK
jgi:hypothetical protein